MRPKVFISYAHEDTIWLTELIRHLGALRNRGLIDPFSDRQIKAGSGWKNDIEEAIINSQVFILIITKYFLDSEYCSKTELNAALSERKKRGARVIPIIAAPCDWRALPITELDIRPVDKNKNIRPIVLWRNKDIPLSEIAAEIRSMVEADFATEEGFTNDQEETVKPNDEVAKVSDKDASARRKTFENLCSQYASCKKPRNWPRLYRGAGIGTFWHAHDARLTGFVARGAGSELSKERIVRHVSFGNVDGPFISLVRSYAVAEQYAVEASRRVPSKSNPSHVYEIMIPEHSDDINIFDPIILLSKTISRSADYQGIYHNGGMDLLAGLLDPKNWGKLLPRTKTPEIPASTETPIVSLDLECLLHILRDTEILAVGRIPPKYIINRFEVW